MEFKHGIQYAPAQIPIDPEPSIFWRLAHAVLIWDAHRLDLARGVTSARLHKIQWENERRLDLAFSAKYEKRYCRSNDLQH